MIIYLKIKDLQELDLNHNEIDDINILSQVPFIDLQKFNLC